jgi:hypothetical protein
VSSRTARTAQRNPVSKKPKKKKKKKKERESSIERKKEGGSFTRLQRENKLDQVMRE